MPTALTRLRTESHVSDCSNYESKLDIYYRRGATTPQPTVVYFHGGFWAAGNKEGAVTKILPWMEMGWNVVNVEYPPRARRACTGGSRRLPLCASLSRRAGEDVHD
jgi:acetyl esterase/lipase